MSLVTSAADRLVEVAGGFDIVKRILQDHAWKEMQQAKTNVANKEDLRESCVLALKALDRYEAIVAVTP